jgi:hypothetical protein
VFLLLILLLTGFTGRAEEPMRFDPLPENIIFIQPGWTVSTVLEVLGNRGLDLSDIEMPSEGGLAAGMHVLCERETGSSFVLRLAEAQSSAASQWGSSVSTSGCRR